MTARGLTLIETLGAVSLLALMGALSASLIRSARQSLETSDPSVHIADLEALTEALLDDPELFGINPLRLEATSDDAFDVPWPAQIGDSENREPARARILTSDNVGHAWMTLEWRGAVVCRWLAPPPAEKGR
jgi:hypothetical protein